MKKLNCLFILILFIELVIAGVSYPNPIILDSGETGKFNFAIDAALFDYPLVCNIEFNGKTPLTINFDRKEINIDAGKRVFIQGNVKVPEQIKSGTFTESFCVSCNPATVADTNTRPRYCDIPIKVTVTGSGATLKQELPNNINWIIFLAVINSLLILALILLIKKRKVIFS